MSATRPTWDDAAGWYLDGVRGEGRGFNDLAARVTLDLLGDVAGRDVVDLGCGEGHVARRLARLGARVVGVDPTAALLAAARSAEDAEPRGIGYLVGEAERLPLPDGSADAVAAVLVLHHVPDLAAALGEAARVLRPGGALVAVLPHPWSDHPGAGWVAASASEEGAAQRVTGRYLREGFWSSGAAVAVDALTSVRDIGWQHRTVATVLTAVLDAGFALRAVREPTGAGVEGVDPRWADVPRFLALRADQPARPSRSPSPRGSAR